MICALALPPPHDPPTAERVAALEERIMELEGERGQLEERLDFAERMLSSGPPEQRPVGPGTP